MFHALQAAGKPILRASVHYASLPRQQPNPSTSGGDADHAGGFEIGDGDRVQAQFS